LSPRENRDIPPLDYDLVLKMKEMFPDLHLSVNGGIGSLQQAQALLEAGMDGVMIGRAAYHQPGDLLAGADPMIFGCGAVRDPVAVAHEMLPYIEKHLVSGGKLGQISRHMLGLFAGRPGARQWRRELSENSHIAGAGPEVVLAALRHVV